MVELVRGCKCVQLEEEGKTGNWCKVRGNRGIKHVKGFIEVVELMQRVDLNLHEIFMILVEEICR